MAKFKRYDSYKNSGVEWLGEIPSHWEVVRLGSKFIERKEKVSDKDFKPLSVTKTGVVPQLDNAAKTDDGDNRKLVRKDDFVINSRSDRKGSSGLSKFEGSVSLINIVLKPLDINLEYSNFMLRCNGFIEEFYRNGHGIVADLWTTRFWDMKSIMLPIPPKDEQEKIASYLDEKIAKIDASISGKEKFIELLKEQKQIIINDAVTKGLNKNAKFKNSGVEWLGEIPQHWTITKLKYIGTSIIGLTYNPNNLCGKDEGVLILRSSNIQHGKLILNDNVYIKGYIPKKLFIRENDIVICSRNGSRELIGKCALAKKEDEKYSFGAFMTVFRSKLNFYVFQILNSEIFKKQAGKFLTSTINQLTVNNFNSFEIPLPPKDEQEKIVEYIENKISKIDKLLNLEQECIKSLKEYKASLIDSVVTGKVKV
ncbi:MAG: restriction endonuclease subunit S [Campylobacter sp.]